MVAEIHTPFDAFERASKEVAIGNLKVFAKIGREFARFMATVPDDAGEDSPEFLAFAAGLRHGPPPDGQDYLREAFAHYQRQRRESDPGARAARILLANLKIGVHEQARLQSQITAAVDAPIVTVEDLGARVLHRWIPSSTKWPRVAHDPQAKMIGWLAARVRREAIKATQEVVTATLMVLAVPIDSDASSPRSGQTSGMQPTYTALALATSSTCFVRMRTRRRCSRDPSRPSRSRASGRASFRKASCSWRIRASRGLPDLRRAAGCETLLDDDVPLGWPERPVQSSFRVEAFPLASKWWFCVNSRRVPISEGTTTLHKRRLPAKEDEDLTVPRDRVAWIHRRFGGIADVTAIHQRHADLLIPAHCDLL